MNVGLICSRKPVTVAPGADVVAAARLMREQHVGFLVVVESLAGRSAGPVGVLTDRDIATAVVATEVEPHSIAVRDVMRTHPLLVAEDASIESALREMREIGVRRVPVVNAQGQLSGVLSLDDVIDELAEQLADIAGSIRKGQRVERQTRPTIS
ncbi:MAG: CBS domain-containing protein [Steroidobacteraceae bacterium]